MFVFALIKAKITSNTMVTRYPEIRSPCLVPLSSLKYGAALPSLIAHNCGFSIKIYTLLINSLPNPNFFKTHNKKEWFIESNAFSISTVMKKPPISKELVISKTSDTS